MNRVEPVVDLSSLKLKILSKDLKSHPIFEALHTIDDLRYFMSWHVFAVWDFMTLTKRLQHEFSPITLPWIPPALPTAARLINDIVLGEESDVMPDGSHASHFDLYLIAMREVGANTSQIEHFVNLVRSKVAVDAALKIVGAPDAVQSFVLSTISSATSDSVYQVLGSFLYGREDVIPHMFRRLLVNLSLPQEKIPMFRYYLQRHIDLDGDSHGPAANRLIHEVSASNADLLEQVNCSGIKAIECRIALWNELQSALVQ